MEVFFLPTTAFKKKVRERKKKAACAIAQQKTLYCPIGWKTTSPKGGFTDDE